MGYHLHATNKEAGTYYFGAFSWSWLLDQGVGLAINTGRGLESYSYLYQPDVNGFSPRDNDGFCVSEDQAKLMAQLARAVVHLQQERRKMFDQFSAEKQAEMQQDRNRYPNLPAREDFVEKADKFAEWAEKSGGFTIH